MELKELLVGVSLNLLFHFQLISFPLWNICRKYPLLYDSFGFFFVGGAKEERTRGDQAVKAKAARGKDLLYLRMSRWSVI